MKPLEALGQAIFYISGLCSQQTLNKPGAIIRRLSAKAREALRQLKSSDIDESHERLDVKYCVGSDQYYQNKEFQKDKLEFDKKIASSIPSPPKYEK